VNTPGAEHHSAPAGHPPRSPAHRHSGRVPTHNDVCDPYLTCHPLLTIFVGVKNQSLLMDGTTLLWNFAPQSRHSARMLRQN
jgi:hypothetical protein